MSRLSAALVWTRLRVGIFGEYGIAFVLGQEKIYQGRYILPALPPGSNFQFNDIEPEVENFTKLSPAHHLFELPVGSGNDAHSRPLVKYAG